VGKLIPFLPGDASKNDLMLVAEGKKRLPEIHVDVDELGRIKTGSVDDSDRIRGCSNIGMKDREGDGRTGDGFRGFQ
jgi:hypothetical protein